MGEFWILDENGEPIPSTMESWAERIESRRRGNWVVAREKVADGDVSTVFLGIDHGFGKDCEPVLWETLVFGGRFDMEMERCTGPRANAVAMHKRMVEVVSAEGT